MPDLLQQLLLSLISGFSELMFVSESAHQVLFQTLTGYTKDDSALFLAIHAGCLAALMLDCRKRIKRLRYEKRLERANARRRTRQADPSVLVDIRILNTAAAPLLLLLVVYRPVQVLGNQMGLLLLFMILNGVVLFLPRLFRSGNKKGLTFTKMDGILMGLAAVIGTIPGFSRLGCIFSTGTATGADKQYALDISYLISIPAVAIMLGFDLAACLGMQKTVAGLELFGCFLSGVAAFAGAYMAIRFTRYICRRTDAVGFAYYSWGLAVFLFLLYLIVP